MGRRGRPRTANSELRENNYRQDGKYVMTNGLKPWHERIVDFMVLQPNAKIVDIARQFDVTPQWIGQLIKTDAFEEYYNTRMSKHQDIMHTTIINKMQGVAVKAFDKMAEKLDEKDLSFSAAREAADLTLKGLGYTSNGSGVNVNVGKAQQASVTINVESEAVRRARERIQARMVENGKQIQRDEDNYSYVTAALEVPSESIEIEDAIDVTPTDED